MSKPQASQSSRGVVTFRPLGGGAERELKGVVNGQKRKPPGAVK